MIRAGTMPELLARDGRWTFADVGSSRQQSCAIAVGRKQSRNFTFEEALQTLREFAHFQPVSIVIEAPLWVAGEEHRRGGGYSRCFEERSVADSHSRCLVGG
jgi:hypothetical protein